VQSKIGHARRRVSRIAVFDAVLAGQAHDGDREPLSPYGFAIKTKQFAKYGGKSGLGFYERGLRYIIEINKQGRRGEGDQMTDIEGLTTGQERRRNSSSLSRRRRRYWAFCIDGRPVVVSKLILKNTHRKSKLSE
jgi:hypothetical protein